MLSILVYTHSPLEYIEGIKFLIIATSRLRWWPNWQKDLTEVDYKRSCFSRPSLEGRRAWPCTQLAGFILLMCAISIIRWFVEWMQLLLVCTIVNSLVWNRTTGTLGRYWIKCNNCKVNCLIITHLHFWLSVFFLILYLMYLKNTFYFIYRHLTHYNNVSVNHVLK